MMLWILIDHSNGMRHLISGSQSDLLYMYQMLNRVMHGDTISDARRDIRKSRIYEEEERIVNSMVSSTPTQTSHLQIRNSSPVTIPNPTMGYSETDSKSGVSNVESLIPVS